MIDFYRLLRPRHWLRFKAASKTLDEHILRAISDRDIEWDGEYYAIASGLRLWCGNYPFHFGGNGEAMPSSRVVDLLFEFLATKQ